MSATVTPRQVAQALAIGESTVKRWCDKGLIETVRTAGGHRKMPVSEVLRFVREHNHRLVSPEILGLPPVGDVADTAILRSLPLLVEALLDGDEGVARGLVFNLYLARHSLSKLCDDLVAAAFREIGERWACREAEVFQERRGCEIALRILYDLRRIQPPPATNWLAIGGTISGDHYALPTAMAELVLRDVGFWAISLGTSIPFESLEASVRSSHPKLFWVNVSHVEDESSFVDKFEGLWQACQASGTALVVGGRALTEELRQQISFSAYGDNMQHLENFARTLLQQLGPDDPHEASPFPAPEATEVP